MIKKIVSNNENILVHKMIENNNIDSLVKYRVEKCNIIFETENYESLDNILAKEIESIELIRILNKIVSELIKLDVYLISENNLILDIRNIYIDGKDIKFVVNYSGENSGGFNTLFRSVLSNSKIKIDKSSSKIIQLNNLINSEKASLENYLEVLSEDIKIEEELKINKVDQKIVIEDISKKSIVEKILTPLLNNKNKNLIRNNYVK